MDVLGMDPESCSEGGRHADEKRRKKAEKRKERKGGPQGISSK